MKNPAALIVHICEKQAWEKASEQGEYRAASLDTEGFIHASRPDQVVQVANRYYPKTRSLILLWVDPSKLASRLQYDPVGDDHFPHIYGPINLDSVVKVTPFLPDADGLFR